MIDNNFTIKMKRWLDAGNHTETADIMEGAMMLLQLNRNQALFNTIARRPQMFVAKIEYEMKKFLPIRLAQLTMADVKELDEQITPLIKEAIDTEPAGNDNMDDETSGLSSRVGKRQDHGELPFDIKAIWEKNAARWKKIKEVYNLLLSLSEPCDRYEYLVLLKELWYAYKADFDRYDSFIITADDNGDRNENAENPASDSLQLAKDITNARAYISKNIDKLVELRKATKQDKRVDEKYIELHKKLAGRVAVLVNNKQAIGDDLLQKLVDEKLVTASDGAEEKG